MTGIDAENQWYIARDGQQHGPISETEMRLFVDNGHLKSTDLLWRPGFPDWRPAHTVFPPPKVDPAPPQPFYPAAGAPNPASPFSPSAENAPEPKPSAGIEQPSPHKPNTPRASGAATQATAATAGGWSPSSSYPASADPATAAPSRTSPSTSIARDRALAPTQLSTGSDQYDTGGNGTFSGMTANSGPMRTVLTGLVIAIVLGTGAYVITQKDTILGLFGVKSASKEVPVVRAQQTETAALSSAATATDRAVATPALPSNGAEDDGNSDTATPAMATSAPGPDTKRERTAALAAPPAQSALESADPSQTQKKNSLHDAYYQQSDLWQFMKREYPDWYRDRISEASSMLDGDKPARDATKHLVEALVTLRRKYAADAMQADTTRLKAIADAFLSNLQTLSAKGPDTCYGFISQGEVSPKSIDLFHQPRSAPALEAQAVAIFEAAAAGKSKPAQHERPKKEDYDVLAAQLGKLGWSQADLQLFADPKALAKAPPARVCQMVSDWFKAHVSIPDATVQERLLYETLRPVVAG